MRDKKVIGRLSIPVPRLILGPKKLDFALQGSASGPRLKFEVGMSQVVDLEIECSSLECNLLDELGDRFYVFNMYLIDGQNKEKSNCSTAFENLNYNNFGRNSAIFQDEKLRQFMPTELSEEARPAQIVELGSSGLEEKLNLSKSFSSFKELSAEDIHRKVAKCLLKAVELTHSHNNNRKYANNGKKLSWDNLEGVKLKYTISLKDAGTASIEIALCANSSIYENFKLVGEVYINLRTLIGTNSGQTSLESPIERKFEGQLLLDGSCVGTISGTFKIKVCPFVSQLTCGVLTERGLVANTDSPTFKHQKGKTNHDSYYETSVWEIQRLKEKLMASMMSIQSKNLLNFSSKEEDFKLNLCLAKLIEELSNLQLKLVDPFDYKAREDLTDAQDILIDLASSINSLLIDIDNQFKIKTFSILSTVLARPELSLEALRIEEQDDTDSSEKRKKKNVNKAKVAIGVRFQRLLYDCLDTCLKLFKQKVGW